MAPPTREKHRFGLLEVLVLLGLAGLVWLVFLPSDSPTVMYQLIAIGVLMILSPIGLVISSPREKR